MCNNNRRTNNIFEEAIRHCRWKTVLQNDVLNKINISDYKNNSFEEIYVKIYSICDNVKGTGKLSAYDITSAICRFYKINIDKVYIIGNGPKRAIKLLQLNAKTQKMNNNIKLKYVEISDIINGFNSKEFYLDDAIKNEKNGDIFESYICNWQKKIKT